MGDELQFLARCFKADKWNTPLIAERYTIKSVLGRGGMGEVYLAHDHRLDTDVALKRVPLELALEENIRKALVREAQILARLSDTHIVRLFDLADTPDGMFLVLEYVCGPSLDKFLERRKTLTVEELNHLMQHIARALGRAHGMGIVHRDLKPANLLIALRDEDQRHYLQSGVYPATLLGTEIKVADFGLAKVVQQTRVEASGIVSGTPAYMAPEQFRGELPGPETDIYSLGFVAYRCLAGSVPLGGAQPVYFHLEVTPPPIAGVPDHINAAIQKAIRKDRHERFRSAADFADALLKPVQPAVVAQATQPKQTDDAPPRRRYWKVKTAEQSFKLPPKLLLVMGIISLISLVFGMLGRLSSHKQGSTTYGAAVGPSESAPPAADPPVQPLNPAPRIDAPPPVIESARRNAVSNPMVPGIEHPEVLARIPIPGRSAFGFGPDGTLYVTEDNSQIGALRDGKLAWQFHMGGDYGKFMIAPDGLIWFLSQQGAGRLFCFNAIGQGGEFIDYAIKQKYLAVFNSLREPALPVRCLSQSAQQNLPAIQQLAGPGRVPWITTLDQECRGDPIWAADGKTMLQTASGTVYLLSPTGQILWTYTPPCQLDQPLVRLVGDVIVAACSDDRHLVGIEAGKQKFFIASNQWLSPPFAMDSAGNFYRQAASEEYNLKYLIKTASDGHDLWKVPVRETLQPLALLGPDRKLYLLTWFGKYREALIFGDAEK